MATKKKQDFNLVVNEAFQDYEKGEIITDQQVIDEMLSSEWSGHVMRSPKQEDSVKQDPIPT